jgi:tetratricopeptide (TPR) repeat protein
MTPPTARQMQTDPRTGGPRPRGALRLVVAAALAGALALAAFTLLDRTPTTRPSGANVPVLGAARRDAGDTDAEVRRLQAAVRAAPGAVAPRVGLAAAYLQKARETSDPGFYSRADRLLRDALQADPSNASALVQSGRLALARHDFAAALDLARRAQRLAPDSLARYPVVVDALIELGRYGEAERELQAMIDAQPSFAAYARVSYFRELHGDLPGAVDAMRRAITSAGPIDETFASLQTLLGGLELTRGRPAAARRAYAAALAIQPGYLPALAGRPRAAAAQGNLDASVRGWRRVVATLPLPEYTIALAEGELAAGEPAAARRDLDLVDAERRLLAASGVNTDVELALFEADHGNARRGLEVARRAWAAAPSVRSADALGWALTRAGRPREGLAWARRALRLGSLDASFQFHAGMSALTAGKPGEARRRLRTALRHGLAASPWHAQRARQALRAGARGTA